jgi:hypothetical protein
MAYALHVDKEESDGTIRIRHTFYGDTLEECERLRDHHGEGCKAFGPALDQGRFIEESEEIDEIPEWEADDEDE